MRPVLFIIVVLLSPQALSQQPIKVDPFDFTRTPCEHRRNPCPSEAYVGSPPPTTEILDSATINVTLSTGEVIEAKVHLVLLTPQARNEPGHRDIIIEYEAHAEALRTTQVREAVFAHLVEIPDFYELDTAVVAACRPGSKRCSSTSFERDESRGWVAIR